MKVLRWSLGVVLPIVVLIAAIVGVYLWNNVSSEWTFEQSAAQTALNHSPLAAIDTHEVFTGAGAEQVFQGTDAFGRRWITAVWENGQTVSQPASGILSEAVIRRDLQAQTDLQVRNLSLGLLSNQVKTELHVQSNLVWEAFVSSKKGQSPLVYLDAKTGKVVWPNS